MLTSGDRPEDTARASSWGSPLPAEADQAVGTAGGHRAGLGRDGRPATSRWPARKQLPPVRPLRILLAEDSLVNQKLAVALLERQGHTVTIAGNGKEAVDAVEPRAVRPGSDGRSMPEMDGLEATAAIRGQQQASGVHMPIIAMTAHALKGDRERCLEAGMDAYVAKPIRPQELYRTLAALFPPV